MAELEKEVEKHFLTLCRAGRIWCIKIIPLGNKGFPDRMCLHEEGQVFFVELKRPKTGMLGMMQKKKHALLQQFGFSVFVLDSIEKVNEFFKS